VASKIPYSKKDLYGGRQPVYTGRSLDEIAFPLGGIGSGMVTLGGWGQLRDWEIKNRPAKGYFIKHGFFTISVSGGDGAQKARVLQGPVEGSYTGEGHTVRYATGGGLPSFREVKFRGEFPLAYVSLSDPDMPVSVELEAFNPFIPLNPDDSSIPAAILSYTVKNTSSKPLQIRVFGNLANDVGDPHGRLNEERRGESAAGVFFANAELPASSPKYGSMALAALGPDLAVCPSLPESDGSWNAGLRRLWDAFTGVMKFPPDECPRGGAGTGVVASRMDLAAGESTIVRFILAWHFPNFQHWKSSAPRAGGEGADGAATWKNWYATRWADAWVVAEYVAKNFERLHGETEAFHDALFSSTLPAHVLDAVSANISILKTPTCLRLTDGTFYGFEGCSNTSGCCEGSCTHVWNYAQALPYLFPSLQRSQREAEYTYAMREDGFVQFRLPLPLGTEPDFTFHPCADGQMGALMQVYREWLISGDTEWLKSIWPSAKRALEFAWKYWDADRDGVMEGMQHNTYDIEFYGPNTLTGSLYLGALAAAERMARVCGDEGAAEDYRRLFEKGSKWTDANLFNGEYYIQKVEPDAAEAWPEPYRGNAERAGMDGRFPWPKFQIGEGCLSDQLLGQWYAEMLGLGKLYDPENVRKALESIFNYNWRAELWDHPALFRIYAFQDEAGLLVATWPNGGLPANPMPYSDEVWCGMEYQVASHLIYEGLVDEGLAIVRGVRDRHRGGRRNPWDEFECGHHYARSMASWGVLLALSGFSCNMAERRMGFAPRVSADNFKCFWSVGPAWGVYRQRFTKKSRKAALDVLYGSLPLETLAIAAPAPAPKKCTAKMDGSAVPAEVSTEGVAVTISFAGGIEIPAGSTLEIALG